jgi:cytoskeleton protein RodZ
LDTPPLDQPGSEASPEGAGGDAASPAPVPAIAPGAELAHLREKRGMSIGEIANRLKFAPRQLEALEADDYARLPGTTFVRGMIRSYAKFLETDPQPLLDAFARTHVAEPVPEPAFARPVPFPDGRTRSTRIYLALSAVLVMAVAMVVYEWLFGEPETAAPAAAEKPVAQPQVPAPAPQQPAVADEAPASAATSAPAEEAPKPESPSPASAAAGVAADGSKISLAFEQQSWVEVRDRRNRVLTSQLNPAGTQLEVQGDPPYSVVIGNASHVRMSYRGAPFDLRPHIKVEVARFTLD